MLVAEYYCITALAAFLLAAIRARIANDRSAITNTISVTRGVGGSNARNMK
jgi:hypothetical protein